MEHIEGLTGVPERHLAGQFRTSAVADALLWEQYQLGGERFSSHTLPLCSTHGGPVYVQFPTDGDLLLVYLFAGLSLRTVPRSAWPNEACTKFDLRFGMTGIRAGTIELAHPDCPCTRQLLFPELLPLMNTPTPPRSCHC